MNREKENVNKSSERRRLAEERIDERRSCFDIGDKNTAMDTRRIVHELQVHQIELEMQNEELQRVRGELEEVLARYTDLYEHAPVGYLTIGRNGEIMQINLAGADQMGMERSQLIGMCFNRLMVPESRTVFNNFLVKLFEGDFKEACEVEMISKSSKSLFFSFTGLVGSNGTECRIAVTDITLRKSAEHESELLRLKLAQSQKLEAVGTFAGGIAHDFNNILAGILGGLSMMDMDLGESHKHHNNIQEMELMVDRGTDLTKQLLGFARRGKYNVKPVDLERVVEKTILMFGRTHRDIDFHIDISADMPAVLMDHTQLEQVLINLFVNAEQAMPDGGMIQLSAETVKLAVNEVTPHCAQPGQFVQLTVTDTGIGMDAATQARIFEPFFTTKGLGQGTGLGLASVYGILKSHGGFVTVKSLVGNGSAFTLFLPTTELPVETEKTKKPSIKPGMGTILIVDDETLILKVYADMLTRIGYETLTASGGKEAVELLRLHKEKISLVVLDMVMPDMNGRKTFRALREIVPDIKVLLSSGYSIEGQAQEMLDEGCNGFIQKPFNLAVLSLKLKEIL